MTAIAIIGAGGHGRDVLDVVDACIASGADLELAGFVVDAEYLNIDTTVNEVPVVGDMGWLAANARRVAAVCAIGDPVTRMRIARSCDRRAVRFATLVHPAASIGRNVQIGPGSVITAGCRITNQVRIGKHVHVNLNSTIAHDCWIGDFVTIAPGVNVSGNVQIGEGTSVGTGASVIEQRSIGAWSILGAGSVVTMDIPSNVTAVGVPASVIKQRQSGWQFEASEHD